MNEPLRVLVVDDHSILREGICLLLSQQTDLAIVGEADSGSEALRQVERLSPDVVLMDLMMPGMDGIEATRRITHHYPSIRILILSGYFHDDYVFPALSAGASGYLLKDIALLDLCRAIRQVARGEASLHPMVARKVVRSMQTSNSTQSNIQTLTHRENEVLTLLATGLTDAEIAGELHIAEVTVRTHVRNLLDKLRCATRVQAAIYALKQGLVSIGEAWNHCAML